MAECVSCGKDIPAGKFFCEDCFKKMKGRRGMLRKVSPAPAGRQAGAGETSPAGPAAPVEGGGPGAPGEGIAQEGGEPAGVRETYEARRASGTLTPAAGKKVVSLKPTLEKASRDKGGASKKKFTITITFSERTYAALSRLKRKREEQPPGVEGLVGEGVPPAAAAPAKRRRGGPHGRPQLKAVKALAGQKAAEQRTLARLVMYREREWDKRDKAAAAAAGVSAGFVVALCFAGWVRVTLSGVGESAYPAVNVSGVDLGLPTYVMIALVVGPLLYMVAAARLGGRLRKVDHGVVLLAAGIIFIPLFYTTIALNGLITHAAAGNLGGGAAYSQLAMQARQTLWPAYLVILMDVVLAFSGLVRLAERRGGKAVEG